MDEPGAIEVALLVTDALEHLGVTYLVGGSLASAVHGVVRTTLDADLLADLRSEHVTPLVEALKDAFHADPEMIADAVERRGSFNLLHNQSMFKVDIFVSKGRAYDTAQFSRRVLQVVQSSTQRTAYIASSEDTILSKLEWYRLGNEVSDRQWKDILGVLKVQAGRLDAGYLRRWAADLKVADLLERALHEAG